MSAEKNIRIKQKIDTTEQWESNNPILLKGEIGIEKTAARSQFGGEGSIRLKIGDGETPWKSLKYPLGYVTENGGFVAGAGATGINYDTLFSGISIGAGAEANDNTISIGSNAYSLYGGTAIGASSHAEEGGLAIGTGATSYVGSIQIGQGTNDIANTVQFYDYPLLDADGKIYEDRLPNISTNAVVEDCLLLTTCSPNDDNSYVTNGTDCVYIYLQGFGVNWCSSSWKDEYLDATKYDLYIDFPNFGDERFTYNGGFPVNGNGTINFSTWDFYRQTFEKDHIYGAIVDNKQVLCIPYSVTQQDYWADDYYERIFHVKVVEK